ncbi:hypothetical protein SCB49_12389 [unidentified eubacterium SCB49]|nr:hypothetical protein SCB49_12389 [unidentified eubacterium SCB49]
MDKLLSTIKTNIYDPCGFKITGFSTEKESTEYHACQFKLDDLQIISRSSKITPKKVGQFVTFWKRNENGPIAPFDATDIIDFFIINVTANDKLGQFVFPKSILIKKGILSTATKEGKRGFRVYPAWDIATSKQAIRTQKWQLEYFYELNEQIVFDKIKTFYHT